MTDKRKISPARRKEIAQAAAAARWGGRKNPGKPATRPVQALSRPGARLKLEEFCHTLALSFQLPPEYYDKPVGVSGALLLGQDLMKVAAARALHIMQLGAEVGLQPAQAIASISVKHGRPLINGDAQLALVLHSGKALFVTEEMHADGAVCSTHRQGDERSYGVKFTIEDAKTAGLWQTPGPWTTHPLRMLKYKARAFCLRDKYPDVLKGLTHSAEEMEGEILRHTEEIAPHHAAEKLTGILDNRMLHNTTTGEKESKSHV